MSLPEESIRFLEEHIPDLAEGAIKQVYWRALASGNNVLECKDGFLVEVHPDGTRKTLKRVKPPAKVTIGQRLEIE